MTSKAFKMCDPAGTRTLDPLIKSQLLYQLSYGVLKTDVTRGRKLIKKDDVTVNEEIKRICILIRENQPDKCRFRLLPDLDSNQDKQNQNLSYYRYTIGH